MTEFRHGDVHVQQIRKCRAPGQEVERDPDGVLALARGEKTGHRHYLREKDVRLFETGELGVRICRVGGRGATLRHEEHGPLSLKPGDYRISIKRQYDPEGGWNAVAD